MQHTKNIIAIPKSLEQSIKRICDKHELHFKVTNEIIGEDKGYSNKPKSRILIFGNEDVSPNDFNLHQPYVIAEEFIAEKIN